MDYGDQLIRDFKAAVGERIRAERQLAKARTAELRASSVSSDRDEGWRRLTGNTTRELLGISKERENEIAYWLWKTNPLGRWIIEIMVAFVCGDGFTIVAEDDEVKEVLEEFWKHPVNNMPVYAEKHTRELGIFGCLLLPKFVSQYSGKVALGYIDPAQIKKVYTDPQNVKIIIGVVTKGVDLRDGKKYKTVLPPEAEEFLSPEAVEFRETCTGECYYFAINNVTNDPYGSSDLLEIADWLDAYEQFLFDYADKWPLLNTFVWDLMVENADETKLNEELKRFTKKSGSVYAHNEKVKLEASTPDLKAMDAETGARLLRNHILGAKSLPSFWYGGGEDSNLATSKEMSAPTFRMLSSRQRLVVSIFTFILTDVLREAAASKILTVPEDKRTFSLNTTELAAKDISKFSTAIQSLTASLVQAVIQGFIDKDNAVKVFAFALALIGYELDADSIKEALEQQEEDEPYQDYLKKEQPGPAAPEPEGGAENEE